MQHTRIIQTTVALAALVVGSACSATTAAQPAIGHLGAGTLAAATASNAPTPLMPQVEPTPVAVASPTTAAPVETPAPTVPEPEPEPAPELPAAPDPASPVVVELAEFGLRPNPTTPPRPDLGVAFAPCGAFGPLDKTASAVTTVPVDAVADGTADDAFTSYLDGGEWTLRLTTSSGTISEYDVAGVGPGFVEALGAVQFDGEAGDQFLALVGSGASNLRLGAFGADKKGCIVRFTDTGGTDVEFQVGGSIGQLNGVACSEWNGMHYVESLGAAHMGDGAYNVYGTSWHKVGVSELESESGTHLFGVSFEEAEVIAQLDCPGITL